MTEKGMQFIELISADKEKCAKYTSLENVDEVLKLAKESGFDLTVEDLRVEETGFNKMTEDEMEAVAGGGVCVCVLGGGGRATKEGQHTCACVAAGYGETTLFCETTGNGIAAAFRCICCAGGGGKDKDSYDYWKEMHS